MTILEAPNVLTIALKRYQVQFSTISIPFSSFLFRNNDYWYYFQLSSFNNFNITSKKFCSFVHSKIV